MYKVRIDGQLVYDPRLEEYRIEEGILKQQVNKAGSFSIMFPKKHPRKNLAKQMKSTIHIYQDNDLIFRGRPLNEENDFIGRKRLICEGQLAFFNDSTVRPYTFNGTLEDYLQMLIDSHNSQVEDDRKFVLGIVTVTVPNGNIVRSSSIYPTTWKELDEKLIKSVGGYLIPRISGDVVYIDYLSDIVESNLQSIEFGKNLIDLSQLRKGQDIATVIIPLGMDENGTRVTIESVNDGKDYIEDTEAIEKYGRITKTISYDGVTLPKTLLQRGLEDLKNNILISETITVTAADLSGAGYDIESFRFAKYEKIVSTPHGFSSYMLVSQLTTDILHSEKGQLTLGNSKKSFTSNQLDIKEKQKQETINIFELAKKNKENIGVAFSEIEEAYTNAVKTANEIMLEALKNYTKTDEFGSLQEEVKTQLKILADNLTINISRVIQEIENVNGDLQQKYNTITTYFTFEVNGLTIGKVDNPYKVVIANDRYSMYVNGVEVLWIDIQTRKVHTPGLTVTENLYMIGFYTEEDEEERVNTYYVG